MSLRQKIVPILGAVTLSALSALSLAGCNTKEEKEIMRIEASKPKDYFYQIPSHHNLSTASIAITSGDFDKDGDLDIVSANLDDNGTRLYFFEGDGKGNFKLKTYSK